MENIKQSPPLSRLAETGEVQSFGLKGVWVLPGLTAEMLMAGAEYLEALSDVLGVEVPHYTARIIASGLYTIMDSKRPTGDHTP